MCKSLGNWRVSRRVNVAFSQAITVTADSQAGTQGIFDRRGSSLWPSLGGYSMLPAIKAKHRLVTVSR
jgi:hypothetical protein